MIVATHCAICLGLVSMGIWRVHQSNSSTEWTVRWSLSLQTTAAVTMLVAPLLWNMPIYPPVVFLEFAYLLHQATTAKIWKYGTPLSLRK